METKEKDSGSVSQEVFEQLENFSEELRKEYFLKKLEEPNKKFRKKVADMSGMALRVLLAAHRIWDLHYRHEPKAAHFYWKQAKGGKGYGTQYWGDERVADIIFFDGEEERNCFFVEIVILWQTTETVARARWCNLWKDRDAKWEEIHKHKSLLGETYIRI